MGYCGICGGHHDPNVPCSDRVGDALQDMGIRRRSKKDRWETRKLTRAADRYMFKVFMIALGAFMLLIIAFILFGR